MPIKNQISMRDITARLTKKIQNAEAAITDTLIYIGETCVAEARLNGNYIDRTGNLRSSIGYVVINSGNVVHENIQQSLNGTDRKTGTQQAKAFINQLVSRYNKGIVLIVVAGMNYAAYVESTRNVLTSAEQLAQRETPRMLKELGFIKK